MENYTSENLNKNLSQFIRDIFLNASYAPNIRLSPEHEIFRSGVFKIPIKLSRLYIIPYNNNNNNKSSWRYPWHVDVHNIPVPYSDKTNSNKKKFNKKKINKKKINKKKNQ